MCVCVCVCVCVCSYKTVIVGTFVRLHTWLVGSTVIVGTNFWTPQLHMAKIVHSGSKIILRTFPYYVPTKKIYILTHILCQLTQLHGDICVKNYLAVGTCVSSCILCGDVCVKSCYTKLWGQKLHGSVGTKVTRRCGDKRCTALWGQKLHGPVGTKVTRPYGDKSFTAL